MVSNGKFPSKDHSNLASQDDECGFDFFAGEKIVHLDSTIYVFIHPS